MYSGLLDAPGRSDVDIPSDAGLPLGVYSGNATRQAGAFAVHPPRLTPNLCAAAAAAAAGAAAAGADGGFVVDGGCGGVAVWLLLVYGLVVLLLFAVADVVLRGAIVNRTYGIHKNLYI